MSKKNFIYVMNTKCTIKYKCKHKIF